MPGVEYLKRDAESLRLFENLLSEYFESYVVLTSSGTAALKVALVGMGIGRGDVVAIPAFTFIATAEAVLDVGATPVVVDIDDTLNVSMEGLRNTKCDTVIPVHMMGVPCEMDITPYNKYIIEDACQSFGATYNGKKVGTIGAVGCFSFDLGKTITTGEGGCCVTRSPSKYERMRSYVDHGHSFDDCPRGQDSMRMVGFNYRMSEFQARVGVEQMGHLDEILYNQQLNKDRLKARLYGHRFRRIPSGCGDTCDTLVVFHPRAKEIKIKTKNLPDALRWHFAGDWKHIFNGDLPKSRKILEEAIAIPISSKYMEDSELDVIERAFND